jgi:hypothetical protein
LESVQNRIGPINLDSVADRRSRHNCFAIGTKGCAVQATRAGGSHNIIFVVKANGMVTPSSKNAANLQTAVGLAFGADEEEEK